jgi:hypothetical protein
MTDSTHDTLDRAAHRRLGIDLFNRTWALIEIDPRAQAQDDELLHCAHASAYHWLHGGGTAANRARSEWLCARVHVTLGDSGGALHHAERCLAIVQESPKAMEAFDLPAAYEALARAHAAAGDRAETKRYVELGRAEAARIDDEDDRRQIEADLAGIG